MPEIELIKIRKKSRVLEIKFEDGTNSALEFEFLRIHSPSAEVRGHGKGTEQLQTGKHNVGLLNIEPVGNYAIKLIFDDGHDTGIYSWNYLYDLSINKDIYWETYKSKLEKANQK